MLPCLTAPVKTVRVLALVTPDKEDEAKAAGADFVGLDDYIDKIKQGWTDIDVVITMPQVMPKIGPLGKILGPRGLMPNPKTGTVTIDVAKAIKEVKAGKIDFKVDKYGIIHASIGKVSFESEQLVDNARELLQTIHQTEADCRKRNLHEERVYVKYDEPGHSNRAQILNNV